MCSRLLLALVMTTQAVVEVEFPKRAGAVNDLVGVLDEAAESELGALLKTVEDETAAEVAVAAVASVYGMSVEEYTRKLFQEWGLGQTGTGNGVLILVAPSLQAMHIEVGPGLERILPDALAEAIARDDFLPAFTRGEYQAGIVRGVTRVAGVVRRNQRLSDAERQRLPAVKQVRVPAWVAMAIFGGIAALGMFAVGLSLSAKVVGTLVLGLALASLGVAMSWAYRQWWSLAQIPASGALLWLGLVAGRLHSWKAVLRAGSKSEGWAMGTRGIVREPRRWRYRG